MPKKETFILFVALWLFATLAAPAFVLSQALQTSCTVSSGDGITASVRVEAGNSGRTFTFLVPDREYPVTGHIIAPDGSEWWSLDQADFTTRTLESDPWVSAEEVSPSGDCDGFTGSPSEGTGGTATPAADTSIIAVRATRQAEWSEASSGSIRAGIWELALTNVAVDCGEGEPLYLGPQEADDLIPIDPADAPNSLLFDNSVFLPDADGTYRGQYELAVASRDFDAEITLTVVSDTFMTGTWAASIGNCDFESDVELTHISDD